MSMTISTATAAWTPITSSRRAACSSPSRHNSPGGIHALRGLRPGRGVDVVSHGPAGLLDPAAVGCQPFRPPPPSDGSADAKAEFAELRAIAARSSPDELAAAARDAKDERPDLFNSTVGFDIAGLPETSKLLMMVVEEEGADVKAAKKYFHRVRPYSADPTIKTCEPVKPGKAANSYPSGHASLAFSTGVVLAGAGCRPSHRPSWPGLRNMPNTGWSAGCTSAAISWPASSTAPLSRSS